MVKTILFKNTPLSRDDQKALIRRAEQMHEMVVARKKAKGFKQLKIRYFIRRMMKNAD